MNNIKNSLFYVTIIGGFTALIYWIISKGAAIEAGRHIVKKQIESNHWNDFLDSMVHNLQHPLAILLAQIVTIILVARLFGWFFRKIGQPSVIGEMIAGIVLGPSLVGMYFPEFSAALFPKESLGNLQFLSQIGLILFMFVIGMELDLKVLKNKAHDAVVISHASIVIPFALGLTLAYFIYHTFAPIGVEFSSFGLFMGIAMSITAFPVLARIVQERGMQKTKLGTIAITCAAADDITAWCILAVVIAIVKAGSFTSSLYVIGLAILYVIIMLKIVRPFLKRVGDLNSTRESLNKPVVAIFFITLLISAYAAELIGIHALFGAFLAGAIMPENNKFRNIFIEKVEDVAIIVLLPLFFVFTGLRTQIGLLNDPELWKVTGLIIAVAVAGKFFGSALAAKFVGQNWKDSLAIGALMNTRGLMELVVLNIGYDLGVLSTEIFTMMVIMALVTTFMTGPALDLIGFIFKDKITAIPQEIGNKSKYKILLSFATPERGKKLLKIANSLVKKQGDNSIVTAMHLSLSTEVHSFDIKDHERKMLVPVVEESHRLNQNMVSMFKVSNDIDTDIIDAANQGEYDLLLVGLGQSIFDGTLLGKILGFTTRIVNPDRLIDKFTGKEGLFENNPFDERTRHIITKTKMPVGILIDKDLEEVNQVFMPIFNKEDAFLIDYAKKLINNNGSQITVLDASGDVKNTREIQETIRSIEQIAPNHIMIMHDRTIKKEFLDGQNLMIISLDSWKKLIESQSTWLNNTPSVLILKP
ncbi:cation:proton antiporter [Flavobacterium johnsoniae]|uniref:Sodium/hydrogen exchanger n=1 Tax=Flavobacterium johnsoniae (strain ATCC 17061 / DSM 2064 / JCM 8514 / BCRC 14874 / CCUG 350202 / NBRC 14942 / NCIMB 11054 / UW101) TaxID=376686 RepID=A5FMF9_FLAJ1|nr:cation:proton antiporter [Flavobacterium johnsoniae]ABQ03613.1 sodium/hydrogen exchanger [Flavobacterium johnsoniae UW101]OXE96032.1 cation/H(+) antiporter [Flavobacterium johnsoniae UW101]WQG79523.1 cation:proton antiporter [Flavobacterium johnsoniae UW101]SHL97065.1 transporter, CPA2 family [Flavobacterium johnsoniae]